MTELYILEGSDVPWGDYGSILTHGMAVRNDDGVLELQRCGPFIPPISFPYPSIVLTQETKAKLDASDFSGFTFQRVIKSHIVKLDWHLWDWEAEDPAEYPDSGEPEDYLSERKHDASLVDVLGDLWEMVVTETPGLQIEGGSTVNLSKYAGDDICQGSLWGYTYVSSKLRKWMAEEIGEWTHFKKATLVENS